MKIISIIPARGGSKGIPLKNLVSLNKKPLLYYTVTASLKAKNVDRTIVSTDNAKIANYAKKLGSEVIIRPKKLSTDKIPLEPVLTHVLDFLYDTENYVPDFVVTLQNTSPLRTEKHIDESITFFQKKKFDSLLSGFSSHKFFWKKTGCSVKPLNYDPKKRPNRQDFKNQFIENGAIYITKSKILKKTKSRLAGKIGLYEMPENLSVDIDSIDDLILAKQLLTNNK